MIPKEFDAITKADIDALVTNAVTERRTIEYKQQLPDNGDEGKREFLADVSSFANAGGGDIIYGITEQRDAQGKATGIPEKAEGLAIPNAGAEKLRLEEIIRTGIDPRIPGIRIGHYDGFPAGPVFLIRVPKSWVSPHMVTFKNHSRFYTRNSGGKQQLDVREIRTAFAATGDLRAKISGFQTERLGKIIANEGPAVLPEAAKIVLHLVPLTIHDQTNQIDLTILSADANLAAPIWNHSTSCRINFDGYLSCGSVKSGDPNNGYLQVFRSGAFEAVDIATFLQPAGQKLVQAHVLEQRILHALSRYCKAAKRLDVPLPVIVMIALHGLKDYNLGTKSSWQPYNYPIDRNLLLLPDVLLEDYSAQLDKLLKPTFDVLWQSAGLPSCLDYNKNGQWDGGQSLLY